MNNIEKVNADDPQLAFEVGSEINFFINAQGHPFYLKLVPGVGKKNQVQNIPLQCYFKRKNNLETRKKRY